MARPDDPRILKWEYHQTFDKNDDGDYILDEDGEKQVVDTWVVLALLLPNGKVVETEVEQGPFEREILPQYLDSLLDFWRSMRPSDPLFPQRGEVLKGLVRQKKQRDGRFLA